MRPLFVFISLMLVSVAARSQFEYFNTDAYWSKLVLDTPGTRLHLSAKDTVILVASNRKMNSADLRFMEPHREASLVRYFVVYTSGGCWHVLQLPSLKEAVRQMPDKGKDWVIYTEGMGKIFTSELERGITLAGEYGVNVLMLDYPSITNTRKRLGNYYFAIKNARHTYSYFAPVLDTLQALRDQKEMGPGHFTLFFHSMGNILMRGIVKHGKLPLINDEIWVDNVILNAPCVPQRKHRRWVEKVKFARHIYIHYNPNDFTLGGAHLLSLKKQLGEKVRKPLAKNAVYINFFGVAGKGHSNFLSIYGRSVVKPPCFYHYNRLFHGDTVSVNDTTRYLPTFYRGIGWDLR